MKKLLAIVLSVTLLFSFVGCVSNTTTTDETASNETVVAENTTTENETTAEWKKFLKEYESWVDTYIEVLEKYNKNPSNMSVLTDYMNVMSDMTKWQTKVEEISEELSDASPAELAEYSAEVLRIAAKLADAM